MNRQLTEEEAAGMTVNERLYLSGLMEDFDKAAAERSRSELKSILEKLYLDQESVEAIIRSVLENEEKR